MAFRGLFIGLDRYASPMINWLSAAGRDARALHALFTDTFGTGAELLTDEQATRATIEERFAGLAGTNADDVVVIGFSGHGTPTHQLVTYDTDPRDLASTSIPLDTLVEWFSRIPASRLVCILDCCFSGGMGAKVLVLDAVPRGLESAEDVLERLAGHGRLVLTASSAVEPAYENPRLGHGFLTYYLLEGLQGVDAVREGHRVSVYRLLEYVTKQVIAAADAIGQPQHPTIRGQIDGSFEWPILHRGAAYEATFPGSVHPPATSDINSLLPFGLPQALLDAWAAEIPSLNTLQLAAINDCRVLDGEHIVVTAPTSSGKTMVGELGALKGVLEHRRAVFLLPLKALVNDKYTQFRRTYGPFGLRIIRATGDTTDDVPALMRGQYDICLLTYEMYGQLVLSSPHLLRQVGTIVVDEVQTIVDPGRGANLEFLLTLIRSRRTAGIEPQIIALSAVIGDTNGLDRWLGAKLLRREERPVPLHEGVLRGDGSFRYLDASGQEHVVPHIQRQFGKGSSRDWIIPLVRRLLDEGKSVIVFRDTKAETRFVSEYLAQSLGLPPAQDVLDRLPAGDPSAASAWLHRVLAGGVGFHNADLDREERLALEEGFRAPDCMLHVLVATTTLAMGINTPAGAVIVVGLQHPGDVPQPYSVAEYKNIVGRAGRLGYTDHGESYIVTPTPVEEHQAWTRYVLGQPEDLVSRFLTTDLRSLILRVLTTAERAGVGLPGQDIVAFLESSFAAFQQRSTNAAWNWDAVHIQHALDELLRHGLIETDADMRFTPTPLGRLAGESGTHVESIIRLSGVLRPLAAESITPAALIAATQLTVELDQVLFPLNKKSTQKEPHTWFAALNAQQIPVSLVSAFYSHANDTHVPTGRAKRAAACLYWMTDWPLQDIEKTLTQHGGFDAAGAIRSVSARTRDLLPTVVRVAELLHPGLDLASAQQRLVVRLELGVPEQAVPLGLRAGGELSRADYLALIRAGLIELEALRAAEDDLLLPHVRGNQEKLTIIRRALQTSDDDLVPEPIPLPPLLT